MVFAKSTETECQSLILKKSALTIHNEKRGDSMWDQQPTYSESWAKSELMAQSPMPKVFFFIHISH